MSSEGKRAFSLTSSISKLVFYTGLVYTLGYVLSATGFILAIISISSTMSRIGTGQLMIMTVFSLLQIILVILFILRGTKMVSILTKGREISVKAVIVQGILIGAALIMVGVFYFVALKSIEDMIGKLGILSGAVRAIAGGLLSYIPAIMLIIGSILLISGVVLLRIPKPEIRILASIILLIAVIMVYFLGIRASPLCKLSSALCHISSLVGAACVPCSGPFLSEVTLEGLSALLVVFTGLLYAFLGEKASQIAKIIASISALIFGIGLSYFGFSAGSAVSYLLDLMNKFAGATGSSPQSLAALVLTVLIAGLSITGIAGILVISISVMGFVSIAGSFIPSLEGGALAREKGIKTHEELGRSTRSEIEVLSEKKLAEERREIEEILESLDRRLALGEISEETYRELKKKYENKLKELEE